MLDRPRLRFGAAVLIGIAAAAVAVPSARPSAQTSSFTFYTLAGQSPITPFGDSKGFGTYPIPGYPYISYYVIDQGTPSIAVASDGTRYIYDAGHDVVRAVALNGTVRTFAGMVDMSGTADGSLVDARFTAGKAIAIGPDGALYLAETSADRIRKIQNGVVTTFAGLAGVAGEADGVGTAARFNLPDGITVDSSGTLYVTDAGRQLRKVAPDGTVTTLSIPAASYVAAAPDGTIYFTYGSAINALAPGGTGSTLTSAVVGPLAVGADGNVYVGTLFCSIARVTPGGSVTIVAGSQVSNPLPASCGDVDGQGTAAQLKASALAVDQQNTVQFLQSITQGSALNPNYSALRTMTTDGTVNTIVAARIPASTPAQQEYGVAAAPGSAFTTGTIDLAGENLEAPTSLGFVQRINESGTTVSYPVGPAHFRMLAVTFDPSGNEYISIGCGIEELTTSGGATSFGSIDANAGPCGAVDAVGSNARFGAYPEGLAAGSDGTVYIADTSNATIRALAPDGSVRTIAGVAGMTGSVDGQGTAARFVAPSGIAVNSAGTIYVADRGDHTIRQITSGGMVTTLAGMAGQAGSADGTGSAARFMQPHGLAIDASGLVYVADYGNSTIRTVTSGGVVTTIAGQAGVIGYADGAGTSATFSSPWGLTFGADGVLYVSDHGNRTVRIGAPGTPSAPTITQQPPSALTVGDTPASVSVSATGNPSPTYTWQVSTDGGATWSNTSQCRSPCVAMPGTSNTLTFTNPPASQNGYEYRCVVSNVLGSVTSNVVTLHVQALTLTDSTFNGAILRAYRAGPTGAFASAPPTQLMTVGYSGAPTPTWTATSDQPWAQIVGGSGTGNGQFTVTFPDPATLTTLLGPGPGVQIYNLVAHVTVSSPGFSSATWWFILSVDTTDPAPPFGYVDTPADGATGLAGSIAVTGWALQADGINRVEIWRNCVEAIDRPAGACGSPEPGVLAANYVYIGKATFVTGARPDVAAANSWIQGANSAGWGYLLLTNKLPHIPNGLPTGGEGTFTLSAFAIDVAGTEVLLGAKTIGVDNDNATQPFGAIDTPDQGGTVPGTTAPYNTSTAYPDFGWAMTQAGKCIDTTSTSSYQVIIDGVSRPLTAGSNWIAGATRSDLEAAFPGLCNTTNALALYHIDVGALGLANGLHTIMWSVTDNGGNVGNIGSRYFNVQVPTGGQRTLGAGLSALGAGSALGSGLSALGSGAALARLSALGTASSIDARFQTSIGLSASVNGAPSVIVTPDAGGVSRVRMPQLGRLTLDQGTPVQGGFEVVGDQLRPLPIGSTLDATQGRFFWQPGVGFLGPYHLVFLADATRTDVEVTIVDPTASNDVLLQVDTPQFNATVNGAFTIAGWALDPLAVSGSGIGAVHVWAYRRDLTVAPQFLGAATINGPRADVGDVFGAQFDHAAWSLDVSTLAPGTYDLVVYAWSNRTQGWAATRIVTITKR